MNQIPANNNNNAGNPGTGNSKKNMIISGLVILVVLAALVLVPKIKTDTELAPKEEVTEEVNEVTTTASVKGAALTRTDATGKYEGKMIAFGENCEATPETLTQTNGTTIMLDNGSMTRHSVTVGAKSYTISPLHYTLSWLNTGSGELAVTCDGKEVATVIVQ